MRFIPPTDSVSYFLLFSGKKEVLSEVMGTKKLKDAGDKYIILTSYEVERKKIRVFSNHNVSTITTISARLGVRSS